jgi:hypothetical protein
VPGSLSPLPQDGCSRRIAATFQKKSQVNETFIVIRPQIHGTAKAAARAAEATEPHID